jgi:purine-binding chemotaxis protein CheW
MTQLLLLARIGGERIAFRAADVQSVVEVEEITPVPLAPPYVAGLAALRSRPLTVIDSLQSLEIGTTSPDAADGSFTAVVVEQDRHLYALLVDGIEDAISAESDPLPPPGKLQTGWRRCSVGLVETAVGALLLVDPLAIIAGPARAEAA